MNVPPASHAYIRIPRNWITGGWLRRLNTCHRAVLDLVLLKTDGFGKEADAISLSQFTKYTDISSSRICLILKELVEWGFLTKEEKPRGHKRQSISVWRIRQESLEEDMEAKGERMYTGTSCTVQNVPAQIDHDNDPGPSAFAAGPKEFDFLRLYREHFATRPMRNGGLAFWRKLVQGYGLEAAQAAFWKAVEYQPEKNPLGYIQRILLQQTSAKPTSAEQPPVDPASQPIVLTAEEIAGGWKEEGIRQFMAAVGRRPEVVRRIP